MGLTSFRPDALLADVEHAPRSPMRYEMAVIGLGGMGSAILAEAAARGARAIGLEQYEAAHGLGSSHGRSRIFRTAYFEDSAYVPLLRRASQLWRKLEHDTGEKIFSPTGVLTVGAGGSAIIAGTQRAAAEHDLPLHTFSGRETEARYGGIRMWPEEIAILEKDAGVLDPEGAVKAQLKVARACGAELHFGVAMEGWEACESGFAVWLADGRRIEARTLVLSLGPWVKTTLAALDVPVRIQRNVQAWFHSSTEAFRAPGFPAFLVDREGLPAPLYGFPDFGAGVKAAFHGGGRDTEVEHLERAIDLARDIEPLRRALGDWMPRAAEWLGEASVCMYTMSPDEHFVIDRHPQHPALILCGGFSGHGFKFAPVVGEIAAELALEGGTRHAIDFLSLKRFQKEKGKM